MLYEIMRHCRNFFPDQHKEDSFKIEDGNISLPFILEGQYYLIEGSTFNDGLHKKGSVEVLEDEEFNGVITSLKIPKAFLDLADEIKTYATKNPEGAYQSESFGGYSYTRATANGKVAGWQDVFAHRLSDWRKL